VRAGVVVDLPVAVRREEVVRFLEYPEGRQPSERVEKLLAEALVEARALVRARGAYNPLPADDCSRVGLERIDADSLVVGLVTAGEAIEARARDLAAAGDLTRSVLLDAAGSAAAEEAADRLSAEIVGGGQGSASCRLSPGYGRWPIESQTALFELLPHAAVGVRLLPSMLMVPRKSVSFAMWLGSRQRPAEGLAGCLRCDLETCRYRRSPSPESET
jgi:hypothetical protein